MAGKFSTNNSSRYLLEKLGIKLKKLFFNTNFYDIFCGYLLIQKLVMLFAKNARRSGYNRVQLNRISSN